MDSNHPHIKVLPGNSPILLSAPHAVYIEKDTPEKGLWIKDREKKTSKIVRELCQKKDVWGIFTTKGTAKNPLRRWDNEVYGSYKNFVNNIVKKNNIQLVVDIHGCRKERPFLVDYDLIIPGSHHHDDFLEKRILEVFGEFFKEKHISNGFFRKINGIGEKTLTYHVRENLSVPAVQFELNEKLRKDSEKLRNFLEALSLIFSHYENTITGIYEENKSLLGKETGYRT